MGNARKIFFQLVLFCCLQPLIVCAQDWKPVPGNIMTKWAADVTPENVWKEYPRPQMVRKDWLNLNGLWDFAISSDITNQPTKQYNKKILVPFCVESALSGIKETIRGNQQLHYRRFFSVPTNWTGKQLLLHFEAVDYETKLWVDGKFVGEHKGGYNHFHFNIAPFLNKNTTHEISLLVWDPTNEGSQPIGKQSLPEIRNRTKYTATSGIWQTVWLEPVNNESIESIQIIPNVDESAISLSIQQLESSLKNQVRIQVYEKGKEIVSITHALENTIKIKIPQPKLWSPEKPFLYDLKLSVIKDGKIVDVLTSYFGMRKISMARDAAGFMRILLNNKPIYQLGPLDQGYWPDGILTPASDQALKYDIEYLKSIGANMDRMHMKVQPERWYYHCDQLGILVWQDMVSPTKFSDSLNSKKMLPVELEHEKMLEQLYNHPSIIQWVLFNESWGQYDTERLTAEIKKKDPSRLITNASGWNDMQVGDIRDFHDYTICPAIAMVPKTYQRAMVLGEAGGIDLLIKEHLWTPNLAPNVKTDWSIDFKKGSVNSVSEFEEKYNYLFNNILLLKNHGLNAVVYTQISDVEDEISGWMTYDRKITKLPASQYAAIHKKFYEPLLIGKFIIPLSTDQPQQWNYRFKEPANDWYKANDLQDFLKGAGPFSMPVVNNSTINTKLNQSVLFLQKDFQLNSIPLKLSVLAVNNGIADIYINGVYVMQLINFLKKDSEVKISEAFIPKKAMKLLRVGENQVSIKFKFNVNGIPINYVDFGMKAY